MRVVVADTGPLNYLLLIGEVELLPRLFGAVHIPDVVQSELCATGAPPAVRDWASKPQTWLGAAYSGRRGSDAQARRRGTGRDRFGRIC